MGERSMYSCTWHERSHNGEEAILFALILQACAVIVYTSLCQLVFIPNPPTFIELVLSSAKSNSQDAHKEGGA